MHHVAWGTTVAEHPAWHERLIEAGVRATPVIDRYYFHSIYFREPSGVLYEIADDGPGFTRDLPRGGAGDPDHPAELARAAAGGGGGPPDAPARPAGRLGADAGVSAAEPSPPGWRYEYAPGGDGRCC